MFSDFITTYLFLGGAGAGTCALLACLNIICLRTSLHVQNFPQVKSIVLRRFYGFGFLIVAMICILGALCLLFDVARPDKVITFIFSPTITVVSVGAYTLSVVILLSLFLSLVWLGVVRVPRWVLYLLNGGIILLAVVLMTYTALLLMIISRVAFFQSWWLVLLFLASSLSCGSALVVIIAAVVRVYDGLYRQIQYVISADLVFIGLEIVSLFAFLFFAKEGADGAVMALVNGPLSLQFWFGLVVCGLLVPAVCLVGEIRGSSRLPFSLIPAALIAIGGFLLRWCILRAAAF